MPTQWPAITSMAVDSLKSGANGYWNNDVRWRLSHRLLIDGIYLRNALFCRGLKQGNAQINVYFAQYAQHQRDPRKPTGISFS